MVASHICADDGRYCPDGLRWQLGDPCGTQFSPFRREIRLLQVLLCRLGHRSDLDSLSRTRRHEFRLTLLLGPGTDFPNLEDSQGLGLPSVPDPSPRIRRAAEPPDRPHALSSRQLRAREAADQNTLRRVRNQSVQLHEALLAH